MRRRNGRKLGVALALIAALLSLSACSPLIPIDTGSLTEFSYNYGSYHGGEWRYRIFQMDGLVYLEGTGYNGVDLDVKGEISAQALADIARIIDENGILAWNGFDGNNHHILDGYGFHINAFYEKTTLEASGYEAFPSGYASGHTALADYLAGLAASIPGFQLTEDMTILGLDLYLADQKRLSLDWVSNKDLAQASYYDGETLEVVSLSDLPRGVTSPETLIGMATAYYAQSTHMNSMPSRQLRLQVNDGIFSRNLYAYATDDDAEFEALVTIMLSYFSDE